MQGGGITLPRFLTGAGFDVKYKPENLDLLTPYSEFFEDNTSELRISASALNEPIHSDFDHSWLGRDYVSGLALISLTGSKRIDLVCIQRYLRPNVSLTDPRENLTHFFPRQDKMGLKVSFAQQVGDGPVLLVYDEAKGFAGNGDKKDSISLRNALLACQLMNFALLKWSTDRDLRDLKNWS